jgi:PmbA protein
MSVKFDYTRNAFETIAQHALTSAKKIGASASAVEISESNGLSVTSRNGAVETVEHNRDKSLSISVYVGQQRGFASTSDFSELAVQSTVQAAYDIAKYTAADPCAGLAEKKYLYQPNLKHPKHADLDLFHPWELSTADAIALTLEGEQAAFDACKYIKNSDGASVSTHQGHFIAAASNGFMNGYAYSRHSVSVVPIAQKGKNMERDHWYASMRNANQFADIREIGAYAASRAAARLGARKISSRTCPVLFEAPLACGLLGNFTQAISGGALYRKTSFLLDALDTRIFPKHIDIVDDPFVAQGMGSGYFDDEGIAAQRRELVQAGVLTGYLLSMYTARKLKMQPTGNASGSHNLRISSGKTKKTDDFATMLKKLGTGLLVTELLGSGVNYVTGDYSRGASGFWVENGVIVHPVQEITIAGNLKDMFQQIVAIGADEIVRGTKQTGSILLENMTIAG